MEIEKVVEEEVEEEKPPEVGGVSAEVGVPEGEKIVSAGGKTYEVLRDEGGRRYSLNHFGHMNYICEVPGCSLFVRRGELRCKKHRIEGTGTLESQEVLPEVRMVRKFIKDFLKSNLATDPKIHIKLNDLERSVNILNDKMLTMLTTEQLRQAGFYFGSILFQYITDGNRYEMAKKDYLDCLRKIGCFTQADMESIEKSGTSTQPKAIS